MKKIKKYGLIILLIVVLIIALIIGITKFIDSKKEIEVSKLEDIVEQEEEENEIIPVSGDEIQSDEDAQEIEEEPPAEEKITNEETNNQAQKNEANNPYYIKINYNQNTVTIYGKDDSGNYTKPIKAMVCSCGSATPTSGTYKISYKYRWLSLFGGVHGQYCTRIVGHILFHSVPYLEKGNPGSLEYWEYDKLGTTASAGCIRLTVRDAQWIYTNCASGTIVEFYSDTNPGPLGKPTAQKISSEEAVRGWDPTDSDANNPWRTYTKPVAPIEPAEPEKPIKPETPAEPEKPAKPEAPAEPEEPTKPETPAELEEPTKPETPAEPEEPTKPETPAESEEPANPEPPTEIEETPKSDEQNSSTDSQNANNDKNKRGI